MLRAMMIPPSTAAATVRIARVWLGVLLATCGALTHAAPETAASVNVVPLPAHIEWLDGNFRVTAGTRLVAGSSQDERWIAHYFADLLHRTRGETLRVVSNSAASRAHGDIRFAIDRAAGTTAPESYALVVRPEGVTVSARDRRGLYYGAVTLWQLLGVDAGRKLPATIRSVQINDEPRYSWRGLMLDSARHYQSARIHRALPRLDGAAQTQCAALAPHRRPGAGDSKYGAIRG